MKKLKVLQGAETEHWLDKMVRERRPIACAGNYIRISADNMVKLQQYKNKLTGKRQSLVEASQEFEEGM